MCLTATLTTAVAAANRIPSLVLDDGANVLAEITAGVTIAASLAATITWADSANYNSSLATNPLAPLPSQMLMRPAWRIRSVTAGIQAADQWSAIQLGVVEWIEFL
jgi:hypothetical protein